MSKHKIQLRTRNIIHTQALSLIHIDSLITADIIWILISIFKLHPDQKTHSWNKNIYKCVMFSSNFVKFFKEK